MKRALRTLAACLAFLLCVAAGDEPDARWLRFRDDAPLLSGKAGGGGQRAWPAAGRIDLTRPGSLRLDLEPLRWSHDPERARYVPFVALEGRDGALLLIERDVRARSGGDRLFAGFWNLEGRNQFLTLDLPRAWRPGERHTLALSWDAVGIALRVDDGPLVRLAVAGGAVARAFPPDAGRLVLGSPNAETTRISGFRVYGRALAD